MDVVRFLDLHRVNECSRKEMDAAAKRFPDGGWYLLGRGCETFVPRDFSLWFD